MAGDSRPLPNGEPFILNEDREIRAAANGDLTKLAIYCPYCFDVELDLDLSGFRVVAIDLASRRVMVPEVEPGRPSRIRMPGVNADVLFLADKSVQAFSQVD